MTDGNDNWIFAHSHPPHVEHTRGASVWFMDAFKQDRKGGLV